MYTIDLLKGRGVPIKYRRGGGLMVVLIFGVPVALGLALASYGVTINSGVITREIELQQLESRAAEKKPFENEINHLKRYCDAQESGLKELQKLIGTNQQWSDILVTMVNHMPTGVKLRNMALKTNQRSETVPATTGSNRTRRVTVKRRVLEFSIYGRDHQETSEKIREYIRILRESPEFENVESIRLAAQETDPALGPSTTRFDIECYFYPVNE